MDLLPLIATVTALLCGPLLYLLARRRPAFLGFLDGFVLVCIAGLVLLEVLPGTYGAGGAWSLAFLALGAIGPTLVEHGLARARREAHLATLALAILGLLLHSLADGAALAPGDGGHHGHNHGEDALVMAIVVHSVPVGLVVWWVMAPVFGWRWPALTLAAMAGATSAGFAFGLELGHWLGDRAFAWFEALVAGSILHVVFGRPHLEEDSEHRAPAAPWEGMGNLAGLLALALLDRIDPHGGPFGRLLDTAASLLTPAAPWILGVVVLLLLAPPRLATRIAPLLPAALALILTGIWLGTEPALLRAVALTLILVLMLPRWSRLFPPLSVPSPLPARVLHAVDRCAPPLLLGIAVSGLMLLVAQGRHPDWPAEAWQIAAAAVLALMLGWNLLAMTPVAVALAALGVAPAAALALLLSAPPSSRPPWADRITLAALGAGLSMLASRWSGAALPALPVAQSAAWLIPLALLVAAGLLRHGGRDWTRRAAGGAGPRHHHH